MKIKNKYVSPIYMDELRVGKIRGNSFKMRQTRKAISFDGQIPKKFNVWRVKGRGRQKFEKNGKFWYQQILKFSNPKSDPQNFKPETKV